MLSFLPTSYWVTRKAGTEKIGLEKETGEVWGYWSFAGLDVGHQHSRPARARKGLQGKPIRHSRWPSSSFTWYPELNRAQGKDNRLHNIRSFFLSCLSLLLGAHVLSFSFFHWMPFWFKSLSYFILPVLEIDEPEPIK